MWYILATNEHECDLQACVGDFWVCDCAKFCLAILSVWHSVNDMAIILL